MKDIYLAGGCFWGVSEFFSRIEGVVISEVGYANGTTTNPSYEDVCTGTTGFAEVCFVRFDEEKVNLSEILTKFWSVINPTTLDKQANDVGNQYRSGIYYTTGDDIDTIFVSIRDEQKKYDKPIVTEVLPLKNYYKAEEYHQDYLKKNPNGYCHIKF